MGFRETCHGDGKKPVRFGFSNQFHGVIETLGMRPPVWVSGRGVTPQGDDVFYVRRVKVLQYLFNLAFRLSYARQMAHGLHAELEFYLFYPFYCFFPRATPGPIGHGTKGGVKRSERRQIFEEFLLTLWRFGREKFNGERPPLAGVKIPESHQYARTS